MESIRRVSRGRRSLDAKRAAMAAFALPFILYGAAFSEGQTLSYSNRDYATVGFRVTSHLGKERWTGFGPEISFGHVYRDALIASLAVSCESIGLFKGAKVSARLQGGTYLLGASIGPDFIRYGQENHLGVALGGWAGLGAYLESSYLVARGSGGFFVSAKAKVPVYIEDAR